MRPKKLLFTTMTIATAGCATGSGGAPSAPLSPAAYEEASWPKLWNAAFAKEFDGKAVKFEAQWIGVAQSMMHMTAGFAPWKDMVQVGVAPIGATKEAFGQYAGQQWACYVPKASSDFTFSLAEGSRVRVYGQASVFTAGSAVGGEGTATSLVLQIDKVEVVESSLP